MRLPVRSINCNQNVGHAIFRNKIIILEDDATCRGIDPANVWEFYLCADIILNILKIVCSF